MTADPPPPEPRPFADFLLELRRGAAHDELTEALRGLVAAVAEHGKPGDLTFVLKIKPASSGAETVFVTDEVRVKPPKGERPESLYFTDDEGTLTRSDPRQQPLPLRDADPAPTTLREVR
jgi:hypothetical protein